MSAGTAVVLVTTVVLVTAVVLIESLAWEFLHAVAMTKKKRRMFFLGSHCSEKPWPKSASRALRS